tara:strand:+ start:24611 stop:25339 length:729 start_codon:yes stop_codon:yes gene_type:complete
MALERGGGGGKVGANKKSTTALTSRLTGPAPTTGPALPQGYGTVLKNTGGTPGASRTAAPSGGGGGGYGGVNLPYSGGAPIDGGGMAPMTTAPSDEDYLGTDGGYLAQSSALTSALQRFLADSDFQRNTYDTDYKRSLRDLGYDEETKAWNWNDKLTASGRGYQNQSDDFASRGMLQSQGYADAFQELQRMLGQQYDGMLTGRNTFNTDLDNQIANYKAENTSSSQAARAEALQRRQMQYGL